MSVFGEDTRERSDIANLPLTETTTTKSQLAIARCLESGTKCEQTRTRMKV